MSLPVTHIPSQFVDHQHVFDSLDMLQWIRVGTTPRDEYFVSDVEKPYTYGVADFARTYRPQPWSQMLRNLQGIAKAIAGMPMELCFLNRYHHGRDHLGWHADDSPEMDDARPIIIMSFGAAREIQFRPNDAPKDVSTLMMNSGDIVVMAPGMQDTHQHRIPKSGDQRLGSRISLTWRGYAP